MILNSVLLSRLNRLVTGALIAALGLGLSLTCAGQATTPAGLPPGAPAGVGNVAGVPGSAPVRQLAGASAATGSKEEGGQKDVSGLNQGIKLHGHWVIDIKNPDGTLAQHHEFENSLQSDGQQLLTALFSGYAVMGQWEIFFTAPTGQTSPCTAATYPFCVIVQSTTAQPGSVACSYYTCVPGLTVTPTFGVSPSVVLAGSITAPGAGVIGAVYTGYNACGNSGAGATYGTQTPAACQTATSGAYGGTATGASISPISVAAGQIIQVTVTFSFS
jgi:hypothetical protein